jgi:hypothetical protein
MLLILQLRPIYRTNPSFPWTARASLEKSGIAPGQACSSLVFTVRSLSYRSPRFVPEVLIALTLDECVQPGPLLLLLSKLEILSRGRRATNVQEDG